MKKIGILFMTLVITLAFVLSSISMVTADEPVALNYDNTYTGHHSAITLTDAGWGEGYQETWDCDEGWGTDWFELTLTYSAFVTIKVRDDFVYGDYFDVYVNDELIGTTPEVALDGSEGYSVGEFTVELGPGTHLIETRDAAFADYPSLCPAGYYVTITLDYPTPYCVDLLAGQDIDVGDVCMWSAGGYLYVKYTTTDEWYLTGTHLHVASAVADIPQTKKNNPIPGHFDWSMSHDYVQEYTYVLSWADDLDIDPLEDSVYIAAHAGVAHFLYGCLDPVISDTSNIWYNASDLLDTGDAVLTYVHPSWNSNVGYETYFESCGAEWIWSSYYVENPTMNESYWFYKEFEIPGLYPIEITGTIDITCDNAYELWVNYNSIDDDVVWQSVETYNIGEFLDCGLNNFWVLATNIAGNEDPEKNPAGLIYNAEDICYTVVDQEETAWGEGIDFNIKGKQNWGMYIQYKECVELVEKDPATWEPVVDGAHGLLCYYPAADEFDFCFIAEGLEIDTEYSLIYYADPWPGDNPGALIWEGFSESDGTIDICDSIDLDMDLPDDADANYPYDGAKIWLVLSSDYTEPAMTGWNPTEYLFEKGMADRVFFNDLDE